MVRAGRHQWLRLAQQGTDGVDDGARRPLGEAHPALGGNAGHGLGPSAPALDVDVGVAEPRPPVLERHQADIVDPAPTGGGERRHGVQEATVVVDVERFVAGRNQLGAQVTHHYGRAPPVAAEVPGDTHDAVLDVAGGEIHKACRPDLQRVTADVAVEPHGPVVVDVDVLDDQRLAVDDDAFEA